MKKKKKKKKTHLALETRMKFNRPTPNGVHNRAARR
jgi:hypothetical protein